MPREQGRQGERDMIKWKVEYDILLGHAKKEEAKRCIEEIRG